MLHISVGGVTDKSKSFFCYEVNVALLQDRGVMGQIFRVWPAGLTHHKWWPIRAGHATTGLALYLSFAAWTKHVHETSTDLMVLYISSISSQSLWHTVTVFFTVYFMQDLRWDVVTSTSYANKHNYIFHQSQINESAVDGVGSEKWNGDLMLCEGHIVPIKTTLINAAFFYWLNISVNKKQIFIQLNMHDGQTWETQKACLPNSSIFTG